MRPVTSLYQTRGERATVVGSLSGYMSEYVDVGWVKRDVVCVESTESQCCLCPSANHSVVRPFLCPTIHFDLQVKAGWRIGGWGGGIWVVTVTWLQERGER